MSKTSLSKNVDLKNVNGEKRQSRKTLMSKNIDVEKHDSGIYIDSVFVHKIEVRIK